MDNSNLNPPTQQSSATSPNQTFPTFEDMQKSSKKSPHFIIAVIAIVVAGLGIIWYLFASDVDFMPPVQVKKATSIQATQEPEAQDQINAVDIGNVDAEFQSVDKDVNSL